MQVLSHLSSVCPKIENIDIYCFNSVMKSQIGTVFAVMSFWIVSFRDKDQMYKKQICSDCYYDDLDFYNDFYRSKIKNCRHNCFKKI